MAYKDRKTLGMTSLTKNTKGIRLAKKAFDPNTGELADTIIEAVSLASITKQIGILQNQAEVLDLDVDNLNAQVVIHQQDILKCQAKIADLVALQAEVEALTE